MRGVVLKGKPQQAAYFQPTRDLQEIPLHEVVSGGNHELRVVERKKNPTKSESKIHDLTSPDDIDSGMKNNLG